MQRHIIGKACTVQDCNSFPHVPACASRATCYMQILKPQSAVSDFRKVLALEPKNETVRAQMVSTQKLIRKIEFEKVSGRTRG
jgi:hypothetical protein